MTVRSQSALSGKAAAPAWLDNASLCSLATALWGWHTGFLWAAIPIVLVLEARRVVKQRWEITRSDFYEAIKLSIGILALLFMVLVTTKKAVFIYSLFQWLPLAAVPLVVAQTYGLDVRSHIIHYFSNPYLLERGIRRKRSPLNLHYLYIGICIVAASAADTDHFFFYGAATALSAVVLWPLRPRRSSPILWALLFCLSAGLGFVGHRQLAQFQQQLESQVIAMLGNMVSGQINPNGTATQMGTLGRLKLSGRIAFRVAADRTDETTAPVAFPLLLQEATYNQYQLASWRATDPLFLPVPPGEEDSSWILSAEGEDTQSITVSTDLDRGDGILTLPRNVSSIHQLPVKEMQRNQYGAVQVDAIGQAAYEVRFGSEAQILRADAAPTDSDLQIPKVDKAAVQSTLAQLNLAGKSDREIASQIAAYLQTFQYSLDLLKPADNISAVSDFLLNTKAGHCEYFASTTALLLRGAGIPARYAVGYLVHEFSALEQQYIVRSRDAHAWTLVYLEGKWQTLDTTPPDWTEKERALASSWQRVSDVVAFARFQLSYRIRQLGELGTREMLMIAIPLFLYLLLRSVQSFKGQKKSASDLPSAGERDRPMPAGLDSELYDVEQRLIEEGFQRLPGESGLQWCDRIRPSFSEVQWRGLQEILALHYRYRFDPHSLDGTERELLRTLSGAWMAECESMVEMGKQ
ncbi:MAG: transglutaminase domain-containing protein [Cyanobacteria bacterium J06626_6]